MNLHNSLATNLMHKLRMLHIIPATVAADIKPSLLCSGRSWCKGLNHQSHAHHTMLKVPVMLSQDLHLSDFSSCAASSHQVVVCTQANKSEAQQQSLHMCLSSIADGPGLARS